MNEFVCKEKDRMNYILSNLDEDNAPAAVRLAGLLTLVGHEESLIQLMKTKFFAPALKECLETNCFSTSGSALGVSLALAQGTFAAEQFTKSENTEELALALVLSCNAVIVDLEAASWLIEWQHDWGIEVSHKNLELFLAPIAAPFFHHLGKITEKIKGIRS